MHARGEGLDDDHATTAAWAWAWQDAGVISRALLISGLVDRRRNVQELTRSGDVVGPIAVGKEPVVADAVEAFGKDVDEEASDELMGVERHRLPAVGPIEAIVFPAERNAVVVGVASASENPIAPQGAAG